MTLEETYRRLRTVAYGRQPWRLTADALAILSAKQEVARTSSSRLRRALAHVALVLTMRKFAPELLYAAVAVLDLRWRSVARELPSAPYFVMVHATGEGFTMGYWDDKGKRWFSRHGGVLEVFEWRQIDGSRANPWHDQDPI